MVIINGNKTNTDNITIAKYLITTGYDTRHIAVECNGNIIPKNKYENTVLQDGDKVEIVNFVGGG